MIDYAVLKLIWWLFIGVLLIGFAVMDGQDMGVGTLLPFIGKTDSERRCLINAVAPHWDGNQVWFLTGGGAMFAAWPMVYATAFSGLYWALLIVLLALILRPLAFDYRGKLPASRWRRSWDWALFAGSAIPPVICGVGFGNALQGVPFHFEETLRPIYTGGFFELLNLFGILCGLVALLMMVSHGANYATLRTEGALQKRAAAVGALSAILTAVLFAAGGLWSASLKGVTILSGLDPAGPANPLAKTAEAASGAWLSNFAAHPILWAVPLAGIAALLASAALVRKLKALSAIVCSSLAMAAIILTPLLAMFPVILPSSSEPSASLTLWDCTSSQLTLEIMLVVTLILLPLVLLYTGWAYCTMAGKLNDAYIEKHDHHLY